MRRDACLSVQDRLPDKLMHSDMAEETFLSVNQDLGVLDPYDRLLVDTIFLQLTCHDCRRPVGMIFRSECICNKIEFVVIIAHPALPRLTGCMH